MNIDIGTIAHEELEYYWADSWEHFADKSTWPDGPWKHEADKVVWRNKSVCPFVMMIVRSHHGALCGYVGVPGGHPLHGVHCADNRITVAMHFACNGGVTYAGKWEETIVDTGEPVWWFGFDCAHAWDVCPAPGRDMPLGGVHSDATYKTLWEVKQHTESLGKALVL